MKLSLSKYNNLTQRIIAALLGVSIIISALVYDAWTYFAVFFIICGVTQLEFYKLLGLDGNVPLKFWGTFTGMGLFLLTFLISKGLITPVFYFLIFPLCAIIFFVKLYRKADLKPFTNIGLTFLGIIYVALPFSLMNVAVFSPGYYSFQIIFGFLFILWANDTGAYFAGTAFGKTKLFERISPKKSWEGSLGGSMLAFVMAGVMAYFFADIPQWHWMVMAIIVVIAGTYGDLVESLFKRSISIKDSGSLIPGHGGFLDRFDGLLLSMHFLTPFLLLF